MIKGRKRATDKRTEVLSARFSVQEAARILAPITGGDGELLFPRSDYIRTLMLRGAASAGDGALDAHRIHLVTQQAHCVAGAVDYLLMHLESHEDVPDTLLHVIAMLAQCRTENDGTTEP